MVRQFIKNGHEMTKKLTLNLKENTKKGALICHNNQWTKSDFWILAPQIWTMKIGAKFQIAVFTITESITAQTFQTFGNKSQLEKSFKQIYVVYKIQQERKRSKLENGKENLLV